MRRRGKLRRGRVYGQEIRTVKVPDPTGFYAAVLDGAEALVDQLDTPAVH